MVDSLMWFKEEKLQNLPDLIACIIYLFIYLFIFNIYICSICQYGGVPSVHLNQVRLMGWWLVDDA